MNKKLFLSLIAIFMFFLILVPNRASAFTTYNDQIIYTENSDGTLSIRVNNYDIETLNIPSKINGKTVTTISEYGFSGCSYLKSVTIPSSVKIIKQGAFQSCSALTEVKMSSGVTIIGKYAFHSCSNLKSINLPDTLETIGEACFVSCKSLKSIKIPSSVTYMGKSLFLYCSSLESVTIDASIEVLPESLFSGCSSLTDVTFSRQSPITRIDNRSFADCSSLKSINLPPNLTHLSAGSFSKCTALGKVYFPKTINLIETSPYDAFLLCPTDTLVIYGYSGTAAQTYSALKKYKFIHCTPISSITLSGSNSAEIGSKIALKSSILPSNAYNKDLSWTSSNEKIATVDSNGMVSIKNNTGSVTITASATDGTGIKASHTINVKKSIPFSDVSGSSYYYSAVKYCFQNRIILGTSDTTFSPNSNFSRVMLVTILWRMEGCPKVYLSSKFDDVTQSAYYYDAVQWAASEKIVSGYGDRKFKPNNSITREQLAVILRNYAIYEGKNTKTNYSLDKFSDAKSISPFAESALQWAIEKRVMNGSVQEDKTFLNPKGTATRAQAAVMIHNYCLNIR